MTTALRARLGTLVCALACALAPAATSCGDDDASSSTDTGDTADTGGDSDAGLDGGGDVQPDTGSDGADDLVADSPADGGPDADLRGDAVPDTDDTVPPGPVTAFTASPTVGGVALTWTNPGDTDFAAVLVLRASDDFPERDSGATTVYTGSDTAHVDVVAPGTYYYSAFAYDAAGNYAARATATGDAYLDLAGTVDTDYGTAGYTVRTDGGGINEAVSVSAGALDPDGRLVVTGFVYAASELPGNNADLAVWRFLATGAPDPDFGDGGLYTLGDEAIDEVGLSLAVDAGGITVFGYTGELLSEGTDQDGALWRLDNDGALDSAFNASGTPGVIALTTSATTSFGCVAHDSTGNVLVAWGEDDPADDASETDTEHDVYVRRYSATGTLDTEGFGTGGTLVLDDAAGGGGPDLPQTCLVDGAGNLLVGGRSDAFAGVGNNPAAVVWRVTPAGALDDSFYEGGVFVDDPTGSTDFPYAMTLVPATGELALAGVANYGYAVWWLDGESVDFTSATGVFTASATDRNRAYGVFPDPDGGLVVVGRARGANGDFPFVARFGADHQRDTTFAGTGYASPPAPDEEGWGYDNYPPDATAVDAAGYVYYVGECKLGRGLCATRLE